MNNQRRNQRQKPRNQIQRDYDQKAMQAGNEVQRQQKQTNQLLKFNNWIKSVLISEYSKEMCKKVQHVLDFSKKRRDPILHVLDVGCGRGQDLKKWKLARVRYMVATDFSEQCIKAYQQRWRNIQQPFKLYTVREDFTKLDLYNKIQHSFYDIVTAQFCFHYMFQTRMGLQYGLANMLSNLLIGGVFIATIPDSYSIMRKINEKGKKINGCTYYENKFFSLKFTRTSFTQDCGNQYGFYLQEAVGSKNKETGQIQYTKQWLISLDKLEEILRPFGVQIEYTKNFIDFYLQFRQKEDYKSLFGKIGLSFDEGKSMDPQLWQIAHLYRVLVCRKVKHGKPLNEYNLDMRLMATKGKQIPKTQYQNRGGQRGRSSNHNNNSRGRSYNNSYSNKYQHRN